MPYMCRGKDGTGINKGEIMESKSIEQTNCIHKDFIKAQDPDFDKEYFWPPGMQGFRDFWDEYNSRPLKDKEIKNG